MSDRHNTLKLSVIIGVRNGAENISGCLDCIYSQGLSPSFFEVIVADGLSEDDTAKIIENYIREHKINNLQIIPNPRRTLAAAFNEALPKTRGEYVAKVDVQSRISQNYFFVLMNALDNHPEVAAVGGRFEPCGNTNNSKAWAHVFNDPWLVGPAAYRYSNREQYIDTVYLGIYRNKVIAQVGEFDESLLRSEDTDFNYRIRKLGWKFLLVPTANATYYVRNTYKEAFQQFYGYAYYRYAFTEKHSLPLTIRQKGPIIIAALMLAVLMCIVWTWPILAFGALIYFVIFFWRAHKSNTGSFIDSIRAFCMYPTVQIAYITGVISYAMSRRKSSDL